MLSDAVRYILLTLLHAGHHTAKNTLKVFISTNLHHNYQ